MFDNIDMVIVDTINGVGFVYDTIDGVCIMYTIDMVIVMIPQMIWLLYMIP